MSDEELSRRALAGYYRAGGTGTAEGRVTEHGGKRYVVVAAPQGATLAVYRVRPVDGVLRRMKRPPAEVTEADR